MFASNAFICFVLFSLILSVGPARAQHVHLYASPKPIQEDEDIVIPKQGCVPNAATAIRIAEAVWEPAFGRAMIEKERPFKAVLVRGVWHVFQDLPGIHKGGSLELHIYKRDGRIVYLAHTK